MPDRFRTTLRFNASKAINNATFINANVRFEPTFAYDIDPVIGSTAAPGFTELATMYKNYRVNRWKLSVYGSSQEAFSCQFYVCPVNTDPGANTASYQNYLSSRDSRKTFLGPLTGNGIAKLTTGWISVASFGGSSTYTMQIDAYSGSGTTAPLNNIWCIVGILSGSAVLVNGVDVTLDIEFDIDFFELLNPTA
jgi:hypothetical protein